MESRCQFLFILLTCDCFWFFFTQARFKVKNIFIFQEVYLFVLIFLIMYAPILYCLYLKKDEERKFSCTKYIFVFLTFFVCLFYLNGLAGFMLQLITHLSEWTVVGPIYHVGNSDPKEVQMK